MIIKAESGQLHPNGHKMRTQCGQQTKRTRKPYDDSYDRGFSKKLQDFGEKVSVFLKFVLMF